MVLVLEIVYELPRSRSQKSLTVASNLLRYYSTCLLSITQINRKEQINRIYLPNFLMQFAFWLTRTLWFIKEVLRLAQFNNGNELSFLFFEPRKGKID